MEDTVAYYKKLIQLLEEENDIVSLCLQGELLDLYRQILVKEKEAIETQLMKLINR